MADRRTAAVVHFLSFQLRGILKLDNQSKHPSSQEKQNAANSVQNSIFVSVMFFSTPDDYGVYQFCNFLLEMPHWLT